MKVISLLMAICFSLNVASSTGTVQQLERHMNEYHYALSVEWDQNDQSFYEDHTLLFFENIKRLIQEDGMTKEQILSFAENKTNNKSLVEAMRLKFSLLPQNASPEALVQIIKESSKDFYAQGASWNGEVILAASVGLLLAALIGYSIWWSNSQKCVRYSEERTVCTTFCQNLWTGLYEVNFVYSECHMGIRTMCSPVKDCLEYGRK